MRKPAHKRTPKTEVRFYVYTISADGVVRYIGKGSNGRVHFHVIVAQRINRRRSRGANTDCTSTNFYRRLAEALRNGSNITEKITDKGLGEREAYGLEKQKIEALHKRRPGQLWNTIDERFVGMTLQDYLKIKRRTIPDDVCRRGADVPRLRSTPISTVGRVERWASTERSSARALTKGGPS